MQNCLVIILLKAVIYRQTVLFTFLKKAHINLLPGNYCEGATPDPIPNSEVKSFSANGTLS